jgi:N-acyl-D-aspartate/D-glutamate deacylase
MRRVLIAVVIAFAAVSTAMSEPFDLVLKGGRVVDPETGLDGVHDVGVRGDRIAAVSHEPLTGRRVIDARGLVVAPGFIDLHQHQQEAQTYRLKALDGVTTALELESGVPDLGKFLDVRRGKTLINFGATASHEAARVAAWGLPIPATTSGPEAQIPDPAEGPVTKEPASAEQLHKILSFLRRELDAGALGVGVGLEYTPGATRQEVLEVFRLAAEYHRPVFIHIRSAGRIEPGSSIESVGEVIGDAAVTGAPLHIVHINSMCMSQTPECLDMIAGARARGLDVTTEAYPYGAFMTFVNSAAFAAGWREKYGMDYSDVALPDTGERLTRERFDALHASPKPVVVLGYLNPDSVVDAIMVHPLVMVASDGIKEHPRNAGSFAHVYARYVRQQGQVTLLDAVRKMSLMPAQRLEAATAAARRKGRLQSGADADIVVFDPQRFEDRATYTHSELPSVGARYVLVAGTVVVDDGHVVDGVSPGRAVTADARTP